MSGEVRTGRTVVPESLHCDFSRYSSHYDNFNIIQRKVATQLREEIKGHPQRIVDLGCGSGLVARSIDWDYEWLTAIDISADMLNAHPSAANIEKYVADFDQASLYQDLKQRNYDCVISSSSLQWSRHLEQTMERILSLTKNVALSVFTSNTFGTLHEIAGVTSPIYSRDEVLKILESTTGASAEVREYRLEFETVPDMIRYIRYSGVSGGRNMLSYRQMKRLLHEYPLNYLEFEVVFLCTV